jgi:hypothetical protein
MESHERVRACESQESAVDVVSVPLAGCGSGSRFITGPSRYKQSEALPFFRIKSITTPVLIYLQLRVSAACDTGRIILR